MTYPFSVIGIWKISQIPFIAICLVFLVVSAINKNIHGILPSLVGVMIFGLFHSITQGSWVSLHGHGMEVRFGFLTRFDLPYDAIEEVTPMGSQSWVLGLGMKYVNKDTLAFVTDTENLIQLRLRRPHTIKLSFIPIKLHPRTLRMTIKDSDMFLRQLKTHMT